MLCESGVNRTSDKKQGKNVDTAYEFGHFVPENQIVKIYIYIYIYHNSIFRIGKLQDFLF